jgi:hypothetical protein
VEASTESLDDDETDWESYEKDVTFERKGHATQMFKTEILEEVIGRASKELNSIFKQYGPLKIKPKDVPKEIHSDEVEFRHEGYKNDRGDIYVGEFRKNTSIREGRGLLLSAEDYLYEGFWLDDHKFGFGRILLANGNAYQGEWLDDASSGLGIYATADGLMYKGEWVNNKCCGDGFERYKDGSKFKGKFIDGEKSGKGLLRFADGKEYKGNFLNGNIEGYGE